MSKTEHYKGKLIKIEKKENETLEQQCERICKEQGLKELPSYYDDWKETILIGFWQRYFCTKDDLYRIEKEEIDPDLNIFKAKRINDEEIEFEVRYYDGGCCLDEALMRSIERNIK